MRRKIKMQQTVITLEEGVERWILHCKRRGLTEKTIRYYHDITNIFMEYVNYKTKISNITKDTIDNFVIRLQEKGVKNTTINSYLNGIRSICTYWAEQEYIEKFKVEKIKFDETIKDTFTEAEIKMLLKKPNLKKCTFLEYECWVLCNTFYALGARASTITNLKVEDLDFENNYIIYRKVKDRKQTIIPMPPILKSILQEFIINRGDIGVDYVFVHSYAGKLSTDRLNNTLNNYYKSRGVTKTGVHIWRRTFAKDYIVAGGSALKLQAQLCHKTLDMTKKYVNLYGKYISDNKFNPLERISLSNHIKLSKEGRK